MAARRFLLHLIDGEGTNTWVFADFAEAAEAAEPVFLPGSSRQVIEDLETGATWVRDRYVAWTPGPLDATARR